MDVSMIAPTGVYNDMMKARTEAMIPQTLSENEYLKKILRGEMSAVEAYDAVLQKFPLDSTRYNLQMIIDEHRANVQALKATLNGEGEVTPDGSGPWGTFVSSLVDVAAFVGEKSAMRLLIEGESHGLNEYREALEKNINPEIKARFRDMFIPRAEDHIARMKTVVETM